jgi:hypothetical protein
MILVTQTVVVYFYHEVLTLYLIFIWSSIVHEIFVLFIFFRGKCINIHR